MSNSPLFQTRIFLCFCAALSLCTYHLHAAPLEKGFALAPPASISPNEARLRVLAAAGRYEHTPYRYGGLDRRGLDCSGLVYLSFQDALGVSIPRNTGSLYSWVEKISLNDANPGDLVFFKTTGGGSVSHVGIFIGDRRFIHAASEGPVTGVIYSSLDDRYWSHTYVGMGRVLPDADTGYNPSGKNIAKEKSPEKKPKGESNILIGFAVAPTWNTFYADNNVFRGGAGQISLGAEVKPFKQPMLLGVELRPEWDEALGIFRLPLTLSWGINEKFRIFAGPVVSFGDPALTISGESRKYTGGTSWLGAAGITVAPFALKIARVNFAPYGEMAWQSYFSKSSSDNFGADFAAGFRLSTGLRCSWRK